MWGIHQGPVNSPHKWPVTRKMFPFDDVIMTDQNATSLTLENLNVICRMAAIWPNVSNSHTVILAGCECVNMDHTRWRHQMETFSALLALCEGNPPVSGGFPSQRPITRSFYVFFDLQPSKKLNKQSRRRWFKTTSHSLWRHYNATNKRTIHDERFHIDCNEL